MRLKSFQAKTMSDAMKQVQAELGENAIIVSTREEAGGVRLTAAIEHFAPKPEPAEEEASYNTETVIEIITDTLLKHRIPAGISERIIALAMVRPQKDPKKTLSLALEEAFTFNNTSKKRRPVILVGPPGAGKTLMTAKMAARAVLNDQEIAIITTDIERAGSVEQLSAFLNILSLPLAQAENAKELKSALDGIKNGTQVVIDTGGLNPFDPPEMKNLARLINAAEMEPVLVLPAGTDAEEAAEIAMTFAVLGVKQLIPTRLDFTRRLGSVLSAADRAGLAFAEASHTPKVADGILALTPDTMAGLLIPRSSKKK